MLSFWQLSLKMSRIHLFFWIYGWFHSFCIGNVVKRIDHAGHRWLSWPWIVRYHWIRRLNVNFFEVKWLIDKSPVFENIPIIWGLLIKVPTFSLWLKREGVFSVALFCVVRIKVPDNQAEVGFEGLVGLRRIPFGAEDISFGALFWFGGHCWERIIRWRTPASGKQVPDD